MAINWNAINTVLDAVGKGINEYTDLENAHRITATMVAKYDYHRSIRISDDDRHSIESARLILEKYATVTPKNADAAAALYRILICDPKAACNTASNDSSAVNIGQAKLAKATYIRKYGSKVCYSLTSCEKNEVKNAIETFYNAGMDNDAKELEKVYLRSL